MVVARFWHEDNLNDWSPGPRTEVCFAKNPGGLGMLGSNMRTYVQTKGFQVIWSHRTPRVASRRVLTMARMLLYNIQLYYFLG